MRSREFQPAPRRKHASRGFTMVELMIVVVILGVLAAVALPSFLDSIRKGRRSEAFAAIASTQQAQERWRSNNPQYATLSSLAITSPTRPGGYYTLAAAPVTGSEGVSYTVTAEAVAGTSQANDGDCAKLGVKVERGNVTYASCASCTIASATFANTDKCWAK